MRKKPNSMEAKTPSTKETPVGEKKCPGARSQEVQWKKKCRTPHPPYPCRANYRGERTSKIKRGKGKSWRDSSDHEKVAAETGRERNLEGSICPRLRSNRPGV